MSEDSHDSELTKMLQQIEQLQQDVKGLLKKTTPDEIAKAVDSSYLSINNLRVFLQILALIMTIFIAGAIYFASVGLTNILKIREEANQTESIRLATKQILNHVTEIEGQIGGKVAQVDQAIPNMEARTDAEIEKLRTKVDARIISVDTQVKEVASQLKLISELFNNIAVSNPDLLNLREQRLLTLLAKEIDPANPVLNFNAAHWALNFRRYDEALAYLKIVLESNKTSDDVRKKASELKTNAEKLKANPPKLQYQEAGGVMVGPYGIVAFPVNILNVLVQNGYLTLPQAQEVIEASKYKE